jgi:DNA-binding XRE family transcriptional regulator
MFIWPDRTATVLSPQEANVENTPWLYTRQDNFLSFMRIREVLSLNLKRLRRAQGLSQEELAHRAGLDRTYISSLERQVYGASIDVLDKLAQVLGVQAADLLRRPSARERPATRD